MTVGHLCFCLEHLCVLPTCNSPAIRVYLGGILWHFFFQHNSPLTTVCGVLSFKSWLATHEAAVGADGVLAAPGTTHRAPKLFALILVCIDKRQRETDVG